mgnify:CR=1 FL=1
MSETENNIPNKKAVALKYNKDVDQAPRVLAKGSGYIAEKIITTAKQNEVPLYQDKTLTGMLMAIELDREIPPEFYKVVAEVLAYVYILDKQAGIEKKKTR